MTTNPNRNFLLTWSDILPAINPKNEYGIVYMTPVRSPYQLSS